MNISRRTSIGSFSYLEMKNKKRIKYIFSNIFKTVFEIFKKWKNFWTNYGHRKIIRCFFITNILKY